LVGYHIGGIIVSILTNIRNILFGGKGLKGGADPFSLSSFNIFFDENYLKNIYLMLYGNKWKRNSARKQILL
jgi:hypothetical protein